MKTKHLLTLGFFIPIIFWATTFVCSFFFENYNHFSGMVSELGALGTRTQYLFTAGLVLCSVLNIFFVIGLWRVCKTQKINIVPLLFLLLFSFLAGPGMVPMPLPLHGIVGFPFPFMMLSPLLSLIFWNRKMQILKTRQLAIISFLIMLLGFLVFFPDILSEYFGLKQRFLYLGWSVWSIGLSYKFLQIDNAKTASK